MVYIKVFDIVSFAVALPLTLILLLTTIFAIVGILSTKRYKKTDEKLKYGIVIPARNEGKVIGNLIKSIKDSNYPQDKLHIFVIAHNCTDDTAQVARDLGATVLEYNNPDERTKGYALKNLFDFINKEYNATSFDGFFLFDADNVVKDDFFDKMNDAFVACGKQNIITSFRNSKNFNKNLISGMYGMHFLQMCIFESRGRTVCHCSAHIHGTGFLFSSEIVKDGWKYVTLTEDCELNADYISTGHKISYCDDAIFYDEQPTSFKVMCRQRLRWAKGQLLVFSKLGLTMFKRIFKKDTKFRVSTFEIFTYTLPLLYLFFISIGVQLVMLALAPIWIPNFIPFWISKLHGLAMSFVIFYALQIILAGIMFICAGKKVKGVSVWRKILICLCFPVFATLTVIFQLIALFNKNIEWKTIPHTDMTTHENLKEQ